MLHKAKVAVVKTEFECVACKVTKGRILFTARQWKKRNQGKAKCIACCENVRGLELSSNPLSSTDLAALHELIQAQSVRVVLDCLFCCSRLFVRTYGLYLINLHKTLRQSTAVSVKNTSAWLLDHLPHAAPFFKQVTGPAIKWIIVVPL